MVEADKNTALLRLMISMASAALMRLDHITGDNTGSRDRCRWKRLGTYDRPP